MTIYMCLHTSSATQFHDGNHGLTCLHAYMLTKLHVGYAYPPFISWNVLIQIN